MNPASWREQADRLRAIPLASVLRTFGATPDRSDPAKWHTPEGVISIKGVKYIDWKRGRGGGGAIDLAMHLHHCRFPEALQWLQHHFPTIPAGPSHLGPSYPSLLLPQPHPENLPRMEEYLTGSRRLPIQILRPILGSGGLYADAKANAVFLLRGADGQPVGAELRGTTASSWHGMAPGSRKNDGAFSVPLTPSDSAPIILCESAIDALSCLALHPGYRCISTAGARPDPRWLGTLLAHGRTIYCGFDGDATGEAMAQTMMSLHPTIQRLRPWLHDWNDILTASP